jgi:hypothetical protein
MSSDYTLMPFTYNHIAVSVVDLGLLNNNSRALFNIETVGDKSPVILFAITFTNLFLATQVLVYTSSFAVIFVDIEVKPFATDLGSFVLHKNDRKFILDSSLS